MATAAGGDILGPNRSGHLYRVGGEWLLNLGPGAMFIRAWSPEEARGRAERAGLIVSSVFRLGSGHGADGASPEPLAPASAPPGRPGSGPANRQ